MLTVNQAVFYDWIYRCNIGFMLFKIHKVKKAAEHYLEIAKPHRPIDIFFYDVQIRHPF
jgi:hypothetical protein